MRLALHVPLPELERQIEIQYPDVDLVHIPLVGDVPSDIDADILLTVPIVVDNLKIVMQQLPGLEWIHLFGTGSNGFPFDVLGGRTLTCSRGATATAIAEWVMAMILSMDKCLPQSWISEPTESWNFADLQTLEDKTLGLVGFGTIGQAVAKRALAFDMTVIATVRTHRQSPMPGVKFVKELQTILRESDHLVLALPATGDSHHLLDGAALRQIKRSCHLVNVARADIVDQDALRAVLDEGRMRAASLDVCEPEPLPAGHWLYSHPSVRLSPHISWNSPRAFSNMGAMFLDNLGAFINGRPLNGVVNPTTGY